MKNVFSDNLEEAAGILKTQHREIRTDTFLTFLTVLDVFKRYLDLELDSKQVTRPGFNVLNTLVLAGGSMSPTEISKKIFRSKNAVSRVIATLEKHGLVITSPASDDRRSREVKITAKGLALTKRKSIRARERVGKQVLSILTEDETKNLNGTLKKLRKHTLSLIRSK